ncbi:unnamed protein product, partial [Ectocarpus sp. 12 AP-2014]
VTYDRLVADFEALECVRRQRERREAGRAKKEPPDSGNSVGALAAEEATERYLSKMPAAHETREAVSACWRALSEHELFCRLTTPEKLQMINHRPSQPVAVHLMIEDCHRRFRDDEVVEALIALLEKHLGSAESDD